MPDLIAQGSRRENRWRRNVPAGQTVTIGRSAGGWSVVWDSHVSRQHVKIRWDNAALNVEVLPRSNNPVFFQGAQVQTFRVKPGEHFVIGQTTFTLTEEMTGVAVHGRPPVTEQAFSQEDLRHFQFRDPRDRLDILNKLPERIASASTDQDLHEQVIRVIFEGIPNASAAAICNAHGHPQEIEFLYWDRPDSQALKASNSLIREATSSGQSVVHTWDSDDNRSTFTEDESSTWAFCVPFHGSATEGWSLYVAGIRPSQEPLDSILDLRDELKFAEIVVTTIGSFYDVRQLQKQQSSLGQFFSAPVVEVLGTGDIEETLSPREVDVTVLFCDLRGFSLATEQSADDLLGLLQRVSDALGVLTKKILCEGGVIGDFHGDAAMGFWGWPLAQDDAASRAARAALSILDEFRHAAQQTDHSLSEFRIGVGIASGRVVAGKIGTTDQVKVTAFGPAVNLASRLESMTKQLNAPVLVDAETANRIRGEAATNMRLRRLAVVQPHGLESAIEVHELLPTREAYPLLSDEHIGHYETALDAFISGDWKTAWEELHQVPAADPSKDFLTTYIASRSRTVPPNWDGVIRLESK